MAFPLVFAPLRNTQLYAAPNGGVRFGTALALALGSEPVLDGHPGDSAQQAAGVSQAWIEHSPAGDDAQMRPSKVYVRNMARRLFDYGARKPVTCTFFPICAVFMATGMMQRPRPGWAAEIPTCVAPFCDRSRLSFRTRTRRNRRTH